MSEKNIYYFPAPPDEKTAGLSGGQRYHWIYGKTVSRFLPQVKFIPSFVRQRVTMSSDQALSSDVVTERLAQNKRAHLNIKNMVVGILPFWVKLSAGYIQQLWCYFKLFRQYSKHAALLHVCAVGCEVLTLAARLAGFRRIVTTVHCLPGTDQAANHWVRRLIERISFAMGCHHICVSQAVYEAWHERVGLPREKVSIIYNGSEPPDAWLDCGAARRLYSLQEDAFVVGMAGRLQPIKGHIILLAALRHVRETLTVEEWSRWHILLAGYGPLQAELSDLVNRENMKQVRFLGHVQDIWSFYRTLDVHVMPSFSEALGLSLVESMFAGVPSVVSDAGGMQELVAKSGCGLVFHSRDSGALAHQLIRLYRDPPLRSGYGESGQVFARSELTAESCVAQTVDVYRMVMKKQFPEPSS